MSSFMRRRTLSGKSRKRTAEEPNKLEMKLVLIGAGGVGKSATVNTYVRHVWVATYDPTIEEMHCKTITVDGVTNVLQILDTAGQEEFSCLQPEWFRCGDGFLLMYSITSKDSLKHAKQLREKLLRVRNTDTIPMVLVGNKTDLEGDRQVDIEEGKALAQEYLCPFYETSAKNHINVDEAFEALVHEIRRARGLPLPRRRSDSDARVTDSGMTTTTTTNTSDEDDDDEEISYHATSESEGESSDGEGGRRQRNKDKIKKSSVEGNRTNGGGAAEGGAAESGHEEPDEQDGDKKRKKKKKKKQRKKVKRRHHGDKKCVIF